MAMKNGTLAGREGTTLLPVTELIGARPNVDGDATGGDPLRVSASAWYGLAVLR